MGILPILFLCSYCILGSAVPVPAIDVDCDNESIFEAVDEALKSYNEAKVGGNQFILYRITEAKIKQENDSLTHQFVNFEIRESVCPLETNTSWKQCDFKPEDAERGECAAHVLVNTAQNTKTLVSESCSIIPKVIEPTVSVVVASCKGCSQPIDPNNEELSPFIQSAIKNINRIANHPFYFELENVTKAERKEVSGWIYKLELNIIQTNCSKSLNTNGKTGDCTTDKKGERGHCMTKMLLSPEREFKDINSVCYLSTGFCLHCHATVDGDDPTIQALIKTFIEEYNLKNLTKQYNVVNVTEALRKMEAKKEQYTLKFTIQAINCSKSDPVILRDECAIDQNSSPLTCDVSIDVVNETAIILPGYRCTSDVKFRFVSIKGFSPLRSAIPQRGKRASEKSKGKGHEQNHHKEEKHGKMDKKEIKELEKKKDHEKRKEHEKKKDHENKKDHSSESEEDHKKKPKVPPSKPGIEFPRVPERDKVTQRPLVSEKITKQPIMQSPTAIIPEFSTSNSTVVPHNEGTSSPDLSSSTLATASSDGKVTQPSIDGTILDFPLLPPPNTPKCPSKVWQPLLIIPNFAIEASFIISGMTQAADDLAPPEDQNPSNDANTNSLLLMKA